MPISTVIITKAGVLHEKTFDAQHDFESLLVQLDQVIRTRGHGPLKLIGAYPSQSALLLGWTSGRHSQINRHEFAPPYDTDLFYGDVVVVKLKNMDGITPSSVTTLEYDDMYNTLMGGFESLGSSDEDYECDQKEQGDDDSDYKPGDEEKDNETKTYEETEYTYTDTEEEEWDFDQEDSV
jgi:hypothetical protein